MNMKGEQYIVKIATLAEKCLKATNTTTYPVDMVELCRQNDIKIMPYSNKYTQRAIEALGLQEHAKNNDGFAIRNIIFYDDTRSTERQRSTLAHEFAHIYLGHCKGCKGIVDCSNCQEMQADSFAFQILFPY